MKFSKLFFTLVLALFTQSHLSVAQTSSSDPVQIVETFIKAIQSQNLPLLESVLAEDVAFSDPIFPQLKGPQVLAMWHMILQQTQPKVDARVLGSFGNKVLVSTTATYNYQGNPVINKIHQTFFIENGKIIKHTDRYSFRQWIRQARPDLSKWLSGNAVTRYIAVLQPTRCFARLGLSLFMQQNSYPRVPLLGPVCIAIVAGSKTLSEN